jgi:hypothetical protein
MKKNDIIEVTINDLEFPNIGITIFEDKIIKLKNFRKTSNLTTREG